MTAIKKVTVLGTGVLGSQIAYQTAFHGFEVTAWDIDDAAVAAAHTRFAGLAATYDAEVDGAKDGKSAAALERIIARLPAADARTRAVPKADRDRLRHLNRPTSRGLAAAACVS